MPQTPFLERSRYYLAYEYPTKIRLSLEPLDETVIWRRINPESNSIGNLLLHLAGNIREWMVAGVGGAENVRNRSSEFAATDGYTKGELLALLTSSVEGADRVLASLTEADLDRQVTIQGRETNVLSAIYHGGEHFSMHTGQIIMLTKILSAKDLRFYGVENGVPVHRWRGLR